MADLNSSICCYNFKDIFRNQSFYDLSCYNINRSFYKVVLSFSRREFRLLFSCLSYWNCISIEPLLDFILWFDSLKRTIYCDNKANLSRYSSFFYYRSLIKTQFTSRSCAIKQIESFSFLMQISFQSVSFKDSLTVRSLSCSCYFSCRNSISFSTLHIQIPLNLLYSDRFDTSNSLKFLNAASYFSFNTLVSLSFLTVSLL